MSLPVRADLVNINYKTLKLLLLNNSPLPHFFCKLNIQQVLASTIMKGMNVLLYFNCNKQRMHCKDTDTLIGRGQSNNENLKF